MLRSAATGGIRRWLTPGPVVLLLLVTALVVWLVGDVGETLAPIGMVLGYIVAGVLVFRRSRRLVTGERRASRFLGFGLFSVAAGVVSFGVLSQAGVDIPAFGPLDIFFLGAYAMLIVAFYRLARHDPGGRDWVITVLDALVGAIALAVLVWVGFLHELIEGFEGAHWWELGIAAGYPILDVAAVIGLMILFLRRSHYHLDLRLLFLAAGMGVQVVADFIFFSTGVGRSFAEAEPAYPLLLIAAACWVTMAAIIDRTPRKREFPDRETPGWALFWPYLFAAALVATHVSRYRSLGGVTPDEILLLDALLIIGVVMLLRQVVAIHRMRRRVEKQRSELVASVSHELRTPLTATVGYLTLLEESGDEFPEEARAEMLSEATNQARLMSRLVSDLIMLARGKHTPLPLELAETPASALMTAALRSVEPDRSRIESDYDLEGYVVVDADRVQQALHNLLRNAVKYGGDRVLLVGRVEGDSLMLEVHDNGEGVPTRHEAAIWNRFERGAHRLNATTPGLGIGLAIVQAVAEAHGGRAEYRRSELLGGACFSVVIPGCVTTRRGEHAEVRR